MRLLLIAVIFCASTAFSQQLASASDSTTTTTVELERAIDEALGLVGNKELAVADRVEMATNIVRLHPEAAEVWAALGELRLEARDEEGALMAFERAVSKDPSLFSPWHWIGILKKRGGRDLEGALIAFQNALERGGPRAREMNEIAVTLALLGRADEALAMWEQAIVTDPDWGVLYSNAIKGALSLGNEEQARQFFERSLAAGRFEERAAMIWADHLVENKKQAEALKAYLAALEREPANPRLRYYYGITLVQDKKEDGLRELRRALINARASGDKSTASVIEKTLFAIEHPKETKQLREAEKLVSDLPMKPSEQEKAFKKAIGLLDPVIKQHPDLWEALLLRGLARRRLGIYAQARQDFERVLEIVPGQPNAMINLALLFRDEKNFYNAVDYARKAVEGNPEDPAVLVNAGFIMMDTRNCDEARRLIEMARSVLPDEYEAEALGPLVEEMKVNCQER